MAAKLKFFLIATVATVSGLAQLENILLVIRKPQAE